MSSKQVIVIRKDLMNPFEEYVGKMIAQGGHGVGGALLSMMNNGKTLIESPPKIINGKYTLSLEVEEGSELDGWLRGVFTKICVYVNSEKELITIYNKAKEANLPAVLIEDNGLTKFNGVKTKTAVGIGPANSDEINKITGHLKLL